MTRKLIRGQKKRKKIIPALIGELKKKLLIFLFIPMFFFLMNSDKSTSLLQYICFYYALEGGHGKNIL